tara:strand:- start:15822 stop:16307 length:486 start_codon:yes stop_codon:yes gene_type:complete
MKKFKVVYSDGSKFPKTEIFAALNESEAITKVESKVGILIPDFEKVKSDILDIEDKGKILEYVDNRFKYSNITIPTKNFLDEADVYNYEYFLDETEHLCLDEIELKDWPLDLFAKGIIHYLKHLYHESKNALREAGFEHGVSNSRHHDSLAILYIAPNLLR